MMTKRVCLLLGALALVGCGTGTMSGQTVAADAGDAARDVVAVDSAQATVDAAPDTARDTRTPPAADSGVTPVADTGAATPDATPDAAPQPTCKTTITYGSTWIRPAGVTTNVDVVDGMVGWDGVCHNDGSNAKATLSNGTTARFRGRYSCVIALDYQGCPNAPSTCQTHVHYGPNWTHPSGHPADYDERNGVIGWNSNCTHSNGGSRAKLSNGWPPHFDAPLCQLSFRYTQCGGLYHNDVLAGCADPGVTYDPDGDRYILACTGGNFRIFVSHDLVHWRRRGSIFTRATKPAWRTTTDPPRFWAPEIHKVKDGRWVAYFSATHRNGKKSIGAAVADNPLGPFQDIGAPLVLGTGAGYIDASYFRDPADGRRYVIYKYAGLATGERTPIYIQRLRANGTELVGSRTKVLNNDPGSWEGGSIEGASIMFRGGYYYLFYSGGAYNTSRYGIGVARSRHVDGPYTKLGHPIVSSNEAWTGPGHGSPVQSRSADWWYAYHAWDPPPGTNGAKRNVLIDRIQWSNGWPKMGAAPSSMSMPPP